MKGIELAINQVVILIIGIVIFGLGIALMFKIFAVSEQQLPGINEQIEQQLNKALSGGKVVEIPTSTKTTSARDMATFYLGIKNDPVSSSSDEFEVLISFNKAVNSQGQSVCDDCSTKSINIPDFNELNDNALLSSLIIGENQVRVIGFGVTPINDPFYGGPGQYFYNVCVCEGFCDYDVCNAQEFSDKNNYNESSSPYGFATFTVIAR